jgi:predicted aspartyl protease
MKFGSHFAHYAQGKLLIRITSVLITCIVAIAAHATPVVTESVDFVSSPRGHVLVPVSINGSEPLIFVLDTAAGKTFITPSAVEKLGLLEVPDGGASTMGVHGKTVNPEVKIQSLAVGKVRVADIQAIVLDLDHITRGNWQADGVLGMDFLRQFDIRLDFGSSVVSFYSAASDLSNCVACPAGIDGIVFETIDPGFIVLPATVDAKPVNALLDSGSGHSGINGIAAAVLGVTLPQMPTGAPAGHNFGIQTGPVRVGKTILTEQTPLFVMDHPLLESLGLTDRASMLMGTDQFKSRSLTICYGLDTLFLE